MRGKDKGLELGIAFARSREWKGERKEMTRPRNSLMGGLQQSFRNNRFCKTESTVESPKARGELSSPSPSPRDLATAVPHTSARAGTLAPYVSRRAFAADQ